MVETEGIANETARLSSTIDALSFSDYCSSPEPGQRQCVVEYEKYSQNIRQECERAGGHYIESFYKTECDSAGSKIVFAATDEPYCVGSSCDSDEEQNPAAPCGICSL